METIEITLSLLLTIAGVAALSRALPVPVPLLQIGAGVLLSLLPMLSNVRIEPALFFLLFVPPLLFGDAWQIPKRDLLTARRPVLRLAFALVFATVVTVGYAMHWLIPALPLAATFALGAIVSPTDALATSAMLGKLALPRRLQVILAGESLINDASGLVALRFAIVTLATGAFSLAAAAGELVLIAVGGFAIGLFVGWVLGHVHSALTRHSLDDPSTQTLLSLLTPFAAYLAGDAIGASGVLAVVGAGLYAGIHDARHMKVATRQHSFQVWSMVLYAFNGLAFLLLGLSLRPALTTLMAVESHARLALYALALWAVVTATRLVLVYPSINVPRHLRRRARDPEATMAPRHVFIAGWAGLRGSVTMAAALALPATALPGNAFPGRELLIFLAATTILLTLCINGFTLPLFVRLLGIHGDGRDARERRDAEIAVAEAGANVVRADIGAHPSARDDFAQAVLMQYEGRLARLTADKTQRGAYEREAARRRTLLYEAITAERTALAAMRDSGAINDEVARAVEQRIDHAELLLGDLTGDTLIVPLPPERGDGDGAHHGGGGARR